MSQTPHRKCSHPGCGAEVDYFGHSCPVNWTHFQYSVEIKWAAVIVVMGALCLNLFRITGDLWPMYLIASMGIVFAFAIAFSRGEALKSAAVYLSGFTAVWFLWSLEFGESVFWRPLVLLREFASHNLELSLIAILIFNTVLMFNLGRKTALIGLHVIARAYLAVGAFILSAWCVWGALTQAGNIPGWLMQATLIGTLLSPLIMLFVVDSLPLTIDGRLFKLSFWFALASVYLLAARPLVTMVRFFLGEMLPELVGQRPNQSMDELWLFRFAQWVMPLFFVLGALSLLSLMSASVRGSRKRFGDRSLPPPSRKKVQNPDLDSGLSMLFQIPLDWAQVSIHMIGNGAVFLILLGKETAFNLIKMARGLPELGRVLLKTLVLPVTSFAMIAISVLITLQYLRAYVLLYSQPFTLARKVSAEIPNLFISQRSISSLWGMLVMCVVLSLLAAALSFAFTNPRFQNEGLAAVVIIVAGYFGVTVFSIIPTPLFWVWNRIQQPIHLDQYGSLLRFNLIMLFAFIVSCVLVMAPGEIRRPADAYQQEVSKSSVVLLYCLVIGFSVFAFFVGAIPLLRAILVAVRS